MKHKNNGGFNTFITKSELATYLSCTQRHVDNLTARGVITKIKVGALTRFDWGDVSAALKEQNGKEAA